jgi:hypothetical protein
MGVAKSTQAYHMPSFEYQMNKRLLNRADYRSCDGLYRQYTSEMANAFTPEQGFI